MPKRILIVDDSAPVRNTVKFMLESVSDWVVGGEARNGREAIDKVALLSPDLVLLDLSMPVMNGLDAARELSRIRPDLPIVMFTDSPEIAREALLCGCRRVVSKTTVLLLISVIHDIFASAARATPAA
jgi:two-component system, NarL family, nitrate/nitrite response regulator NarL